MCESILAKGEKKSEDEATFFLVPEHKLNAKKMNKWT